jgi:hypothetical protein
VVLSLTAILLVGLMLVLTPGLQPIFSPLSVGENAMVIGYIFAIVAGYIIMAQLSKMAYVKLFHS